MSREPQRRTSTGSGSIQRPQIISPDYSYAILLRQTLFETIK